MKKVVKKLSAIALCTAFATMQVSASMMTGDTGLGNGLGGAVINGYQGGYVGTDLGANSATLNFNGNAHVDWGSLNVNSGESLNFNAVDGATGLTVVNTVQSGMTNIYGAVSSNEGIAKLIIANPNGMLFDGAQFTTAGDLQLTTQALAVNYLNGNLELSALKDANGNAIEATQGIVIRDGVNKTNFNIGGQFDIIAPSVTVIGGYLGAVKGLKLVTQNGKEYLVCPTTSNDDSHTAVHLQSVDIDGNVYIMSGKDMINIANGGTIDGDLIVNSDGNVFLNFAHNDNKLNVNGSVISDADGRSNYLRNANVKKDIKMSNSGGDLEIANVKVGGNVDLTTTVKTNKGVKHFVHVGGNNEIAGNLNIDSAHNIHIGGYEDNLANMIKGSLKVGGDINALAREGSVAINVDTSADNVSLTSGTLNIITDGKATISANNYEFKAKHYIGGVDTKEGFIDAMENYRPLPTVTKETYLNIAGGKVNKLETENGIAFLRANNSMDVNNVNSGLVYLTAGKDIKIGPKATAKRITVDGETRNLTVELPKRDYELKYTNIKDTKVITIDKDTEITYDMANGTNGWNKGTQTAKNTYLVVPGGNQPVVPPTEPNEPEGEPEKHLKNLTKEEVLSAVDRQQVMTPVAFAADLDDEIDTGVRKNVDGSVTVVRPFTPNN